MCSKAARRAADPSRRETTMSSDEKSGPRDESETDDVQAHEFVTEPSGDDDPDRTTKRKQYEEPADPDGDDFGKRRK
jgi:hypothetical protein